MAIMISIRPEWVREILHEEKTIEIRKTSPKCELPQKVYIYCTNGIMLYDMGRCDIDYIEEEIKKGLMPRYSLQYDKKSNNYLCGSIPFINRKVVAEFDLLRISTIDICDPDILFNGEQTVYNQLKKECLVNDNELMEYLGYGDDDGYTKSWDRGYAWHIDNLKIYETPKELNEFKKQNKCHIPMTENVIGCMELPCPQIEFGECDGRCSKIERPPQSWCYCENLEEQNG